MKKLVCVFIAALLLLSLPIGAAAEGYLIPGGQLLGISVEDGSFTVIGFDSQYGQEAGKLLSPGDRLLALNGQPLKRLADISELLQQADGPVTLTVLRDGKQVTLSLLPRITPEGPRLGIYLKEGITGVGTLTYYDPESGAFGALGHGVSDRDGGRASLTEGKVYEGMVLSVRRGKAGQPGQLMGCVSDPAEKGTIIKNTPYGVFGTLNSPEESPALEIASYKEVKPGKATIRCTVSGSRVKEYEVEIVKVYGNREDSGRNMLLKITDPGLLDATGGIVQGMSGSPIIQDGKLVGAVTHVLVNDPTRGYGIFIENMLDAAS